MKKVLAVVLVILFLSTSMAMGAGVTQKLNKIRGGDMLTLVFDWVANSSGVVPSTDTSVSVTKDIVGYYITEVRTTPGATAPTDNYAVLLYDSNGLDLLGGAGLNRSATASEATPPKILTSTYQSRPIDGTVTFAVSSNEVDTAIGSVKVFLRK